MAGLHSPAPSSRIHIWRKISWQSLVGTRFVKSYPLQNRVNSLFRDHERRRQPVDRLPALCRRSISMRTRRRSCSSSKFRASKRRTWTCSVENNTLTVKGERKFESEEKEENFHRIERRYGSFFRAFTLPSTVDTENVQAKLQCRRAEAGAGEEARSAAQADQDQRGCLKAATSC